MKFDDDDKPWHEACKRKYISPKDLKEAVCRFRSLGKTIATLNGSFDLLHAGHLYIIYEAAKICDILIVALNSNKSIQQYKHINRPIIPLKERIEMVSALLFVDYVTYFDEVNPIEILKIIAPDVHVNGSEYGINCIEAEVVCSLGGKIHLVDRVPMLSTSEIIDKVKKLCD